MRYLAEAPFNDGGYDVPMFKEKDQQKDYSTVYIGVTAAAMGATLITVGVCMHIYYKYKRLLRQVG